MNLLVLFILHFGWVSFVVLVNFYFVIFEAWKVQSGNLQIRICTHVHLYGLVSYGVASLEVVSIVHVLLGF
jgi:hypothetical protein